MNKKTLIIILLLLALSGYAFYSFFLRGSEPKDTEHVTLWYVEEDDPEEALSRMAQELNAGWEDRGLRLELRSFKSEKELAAATEVLRPDLLLCGYDKALELFSRDGLSPMSAMTDEVPPRFECFDTAAEGVGDVFFPLAIEAQVLISKPGTELRGLTMEELLREGRGHVSRNDKPFLTADSCTELMNCLMSADGLFRQADEGLAKKSEGFVNAYNTLAKAVCDGVLLVSDTHALPMVEAGTVVCGVVDCGELRFAKGELEVCPLSAAAGEKRIVCGKCTGLAVSAPETRDFDNIAVVLRAIYEGGFADGYAQSRYLLPPTVEGEKENEGRLLYGYKVLPVTSKSDGSFESYFRKAVKLF